jgi:hypothetical protein
MSIAFETASVRPLDLNVRVYWPTVPLIEVGEGCDSRRTVALMLPTREAPLLVTLPLYVTPTGWICRRGSQLNWLSAEHSATLRRRRRLTPSPLRRWFGDDTADDVTLVSPPDERKVRPATPMLIPEKATPDPVVAVDVSRLSHRHP